MEIERENSAWDALGERFETAARKGCYLDLTGEGEATELTAQDASAVWEKDQDPEALLKSQAASSNSTQPKAAAQEVIEVMDSDDEAEAAAAPQTASRPSVDPLHELWDLMRNALTSLSLARTQLKGMDPRCSETVRTVDRLITQQIQQFIDANATLVLKSQAAIQRIQNINSVVFKANILINDFKKRQGTASGSASTSGSGAGSSRKRRVDQSNSPMNPKPSKQRS